ncbi:MAG: FeoB-associated Cys-rich membrane protein [Firmicutes bacterium]|nr:FeoB-associated Cys-rich membrane protein [Bacillota bacterium]
MWGTILVVFALAAVVTLIIRAMIRDKKRGKSSCGCGCANCQSAGMCHGAADEKNK